jgi:predicted transcriptional regulator
VDIIKDKQLGTVWVEPELFDAVQAYAHAHDVSKAWVVRQALKAFLAQQTKENTA